MAQSNKVFVSPGVYTSERDLSFVAQSVGVTTLGIAGETQKGPAFEPIFISSYNEFETYFSGTTPEKFINTKIPKYEAPYIAKSYLQQSNQLFVSRILGLSGYDAGPSWSIKINANMNSETVSLSSCTTYCSGGEYLTSGCTVQPPVTFTINFTGDTCSLSGIIISGDSNYNSIIGQFATEEYEQFNGSISTLEEDLKEQIFGVMSSTGTSGSSVYYFGSIPASATTVSPLSAYTASTNAVNVFSVADPVSLDELNSRLNDSWYFAAFNQFAPNVTVLPNGESVTPNYSGISFYSVVNDLVFSGQVCTTGSTSTTTSTTTDPCAAPIPSQTPVGPVVTCCNYFTGTLTGTIYTFFGKQFNDYQDLVVATLRSRGLSNYIGTNGPVYEVSLLNYVGLDCTTNSYELVQKNPFMPFAITGFTDAGQYFNFKASMSNTDKNFIDRVFGSANFSKPKNEVPLFVEENYSNLLTYGWNKGYVRGLQCNLLALDSTRSNDGNSIGWYLDRYQTPLTPFLVSELRGNKVFKLFKFHSISDGTNANTEIKVSIANISFVNGTFDVLVRNYNDTDQNPVIIEKFSNCSMNPSLNNFVAKRIGTADGEYELKSKYVMVELSDEYPADALPCGFEGYLMREYDAETPPFVVYKTKYDFPGEVIYNPPFGTLAGSEDSFRSSGDRIRNTYLGISSEIPADPDFFYYKGKKNTSSVELCTSETSDSWMYLTKGFHMDINASVIKIAPEFVTSGKSAYDVGVTTFTSEPTSASNPYYRLQSRKFTLYFQNGFDGWDIYTESRTNTDRFQLGGSGYQNGACPSVRYPDATGVGLFKQISVNDTFTDYANTDFYAYLYGIRQFANPDATTINALVTPGIDFVNNIQLIEDTITMVEQERADSLYIMTTPDMNMFVPTASDPADFYTPTDIVDQLEAANIDSNYSATYYPWILVKDTVNNTQIYIPATGEVCRNLALTDNIAFPWFATAGYTRGIVNSVKARKKLTQEDRDTLYQGRINPIATFSDVGTVIWGNKTLQVAESALDRINVRRLLLQTRKLISAVAVRLLFEQNDSKVRQDFLDSVNPILDSIRRDRGLYDFRVTVSSTPEDLDRNQLVGKIYIKPTRSLEFIDIEFLITPTGASFENI